MIKYKWEINKLETSPSLDGLNDVVRLIHFNLIAQEDKYIAQTNSIYACPMPSDENFILYKDLTESEVINWLENGLDYESMKLFLKNKIELLKNPVIITLDLPWNNDDNNIIL